MSVLKPIPTKYNRHLFRSRLEARYAIYFDELNVEWVYEGEGYDLDGVRYLPDFYLPKYKIYAEIKPKELNALEHKKCRLLVNATQKRVVELIGLPHTDTNTVIIPSQHFICPIYGEHDVYEEFKQSKICKCGAKHHISKTLHEADGVLILKSEKLSYIPLYYGQYNNDDKSDLIIQAAINKACEAQFEFQNKK